MMAHELLSNLFPCVDANNVTTNSPPPSTKEQEQDKDNVKDKDEVKAGEHGAASLPCLASEDADYSDTSCEDDTNMASVVAAAVESSSSTSTTSSTASAVPVLPFAHVATPEIVQELNQWEAEMKQQYDKVLPLPPPPPLLLPVPPPIHTTSRRSIVGGDAEEGSAVASASASASALSSSALITAAAATMPMLLSWADISIETVLGEGAFSFVFQVQVTSNSQSQNTTATADTTTTATPQQPPQPPQHYALKCLKAKAISETQEFLFNAMDLQVEALILSRVRHEHIIQLRGLSSSSSHHHHNNNNSSSLGESYQTTDGAFLLLEIMETTLLDKLGQWRRQIMQQQQQERRARRRNCYLLSKDAVLQRLLTIALPVLSAMEYLHSHRIVLRDLKPENIGFDATHHHTVKLFDFGLARIVDTVPQDDIAGSVCYMAPEILLSQGTQLKSDVYSMAMVLWELCTLDLPMARFQTMEQIQQRVAKGQWRPSVSGIPVKQLRNHKSSVITRGWATKPDDRPTAKEMEQELEQIIICEASSEERDFLDSSVTSSGMGLSVHSMPPASRSTTNISVTMTAAANGNTITKSKEQQQQQQQQQQQRKIPKRAHSFGFFFQKKK